MLGTKLTTVRHPASEITVREEKSSASEGEIYTGEELLLARGENCDQILVTFRFLFRFFFVYFLGLSRPFRFLYLFFFYLSTFSPVKVPKAGGISSAIRYIPPEAASDKETRQNTRLRGHRESILWKSRQVSKTSIVSRFAGSISRKSSEVSEASMTDRARRS